MAIGLTNITTTLARNALGESNNNIGLLCSSPNLNQWALYKPANYGSGNDCRSGVKPIGPATNTSGYRLGDFRGYDHDAKPPRYIDGNQSYSYYKYETPVASVFVKKGEMMPTSNGDGFNPTYHNLDEDNAAHDTLTAVRLEINGADYGNYYEIKPGTGDIGIALDKPAGTYTLKAYYWTRVDEVSNWVKSNEIEGGSVTLTVTELGAKFTIMSRSINPSTVATGIDHTIEDFTYSYSIRNNTASQLSVGFYWNLGDKSGTVNITVAASATESKNISISQAMVYTPSEEFTLRYSSSGGDLINDSNAIVTVEVV